jgi:hypothetical protein
MNKKLWQKSRAVCPDQSKTDVNCEFYLLVDHCSFTDTRTNTS